MKSKCWGAIFKCFFLFLLEYISLPVTAQHFSKKIPLVTSPGFFNQSNTQAISRVFSSTSVTTLSSLQGDIKNVKFEKVDLPDIKGQFTSLEIGPDGKLYALANDGLIKRFIINSDGTLSAPDTLYSLQDEYGTRESKLSIGFTFDPSSIATNLVVWVTHSSFVLENGPPWNGKLTKLSGNNLQIVQDVLVGLPRSSKDHLTNSIAFGPDGALYFTQGSISTMGGADPAWANRSESLLSGAVLRLDISKLGTTLPLNVKTTDGGGTYDPYAINAPLTIYATGLRNAYDLVWHSNGNLYVPTNGSSPGGNTPASILGIMRPDGSRYNGPPVPALNNVQQNLEDFLFRIVKGGYYGHPNPARGEFVLNGGNPTDATDPEQIDAYPVGTMPDINWRGCSYNFNPKKSPDGIIEYKSNTFNGALRGKLLVVEFSRGDDIVTLTPGGPNNDIVSAVVGDSIKGFTGFLDPLDITEDVKTGNLYVSEYRGEGKLILLRAIDSIKRVSEKPQIFPNPVIKKFFIKFPPKYQGNYTIEIVDILGRVFPVGKTTLLAGGSNVEVSIANLLLNGGEYFLRIQSDAGKVDILRFMAK